MNHPLLLPFAALMLWTLVVWLYMYARRLHAIQALGIDPQSLHTPEGAAKLPAAAVNPANNLRNLCELPVLFYPLVLALIITGRGDGTDLAAAWSFVVLRVVHSAIHCTYNRVVHRFAAYQLASLALWFLVVRFAWRLV